MRIPIPSQADKDGKLWAGQLYLSHTSEITAKLLYKKFYRKTDVTILYGKWTRILREQAISYRSLGEGSVFNESAIDLR